MTDAEKIAELQRVVTELQAIVGTQYIGKTSAELKASLTPEHTLPGGRYPLFLSDYQIRVGLADLDAKIAKPSTAPVVTPLPSPTPVPVSPLPSAGTIAGLNQAQVDAVNLAMSNGAKSIGSLAVMRERIAAELRAGTYSYGVREVIDAVKLWYYNGAQTADQSALYPYLAIIDQRDPNDKNKTLPIGDPRWRFVGGSTPAPVPVSTSPALPVSGDLVAQLTAMGFVIENGLLAAFKLTTFGAPEGVVYGYFGLNDAGIREFYNIRSKIGEEWAAGQESNPNLPAIMRAVERDAGISEDLMGSGKRKTHVTYLAGRIKGGEARNRANIGKWVDECYWETGRGVRFNVFPTGGNELGDISTVLQLDADNPNAAVIRVDGLLRRVTLGADGNLKAGEVVDESQ